MLTVLQKNISTLIAPSVSVNLRANRISTRIIPSKAYRIMVASQALLQLLQELDPNTFS